MAGLGGIPPQLKGPYTVDRPSAQNFDSALRTLLFARAVGECLCGSSQIFFLKALKKSLEEGEHLEK